MIKQFTYLPSWNRSSKFAQHTVYWFLFGKTINWPRLPWRTFKRIINTDLKAFRHEVDDNAKAGSNIYKFYPPPPTTKNARW